MFWITTWGGTNRGKIPRGKIPAVCYGTMSAVTNASSLHVVLIILCHILKCGIFTHVIWNINLIRVQILVRLLQLARSVCYGIIPPHGGGGFRVPSPDLSLPITTWDGSISFCCFDLISSAIRFRSWGTRKRFSSFRGDQFRQSRSPPLRHAVVRYTGYNSTIQDSRIENEKIRYPLLCWCLSSCLYSSCMQQHSFYAARGTKYLRLGLQ